MLKHEIINELKRNIDEREIKTWEYTQSKEKFDIIYHNPPQYKDDPQKNVIFKLEIIGEDLVFSTAYWTNKSTPSHEMYALHVGRLTEMLLTYFYDKFIRYEIVNFIG